jgi:uroporphyrinogen III methyltransferase/synthase
MASYHWIFTSVNGVDFFWKRLVERKKVPVFPSSLKVCAIGPATGDQLKEKGIVVDYTPKEFIAEAILEGFGKVNLEGNRILLARVKKARDVLPKGLRKMGAEVDVVEAYRTVKPREGSRRLKKVLTDQKIDVITFPHPPDPLVALLKKEDWKIAAPVTIACIDRLMPRPQHIGMKADQPRVRYRL